MTEFDAQSNDPMSHRSSWLPKLARRLMSYMAVIASMAFPIGFSAAGWLLVDKFAHGWERYVPPMVFLLTALGFFLHTRIMGLRPPYGFAILLPLMIALRIALGFPTGQTIPCSVTGHADNKVSGTCRDVPVTYYDRYIRGVPKVIPSTQGGVSF